MQEAEELEARALAGGPGASKADRDDEIKPFVHKCAQAVQGVVQRCSAVLHAVHGWQEQGGAARSSHQPLRAVPRVISNKHAPHCTHAAGEGGQLVR